MIFKSKRDVIPFTVRFYRDEYDKFLASSMADGISMAAILRSFVKRFNQRHSKQN